MTALPWLNATALAGRGAAFPRLADLLAIVAVVAVAALVSALSEKPSASRAVLSRQGARS